MPQQILDMDRPLPAVGGLPRRASVQIRGLKKERGLELQKAREQVARIACLETVAASAPGKESRPERLIQDLPVGSFWPPAFGRSLLEEASACATNEGTRLRDLGSEPVHLGPWTVGNLSPEPYRDRDQAYATLRAWACHCEDSRQLLSRDRWIAVLPSRCGGWWLRQGVRRCASLQQVSGQRILGISNRMVVSRWIYLGALILRAAELFPQSPLFLRFDRHHVGFEGSLPVFIGLLRQREGFRAAFSDSSEEIWKLVLRSWYRSHRSVDSLCEENSWRTLRTPLYRRAGEEVARVLDGLLRNRQKVE